MPWKVLYNLAYSRKSKTDFSGPRTMIDPMVLDSHVWANCWTFGWSSAIALDCWQAFLPVVTMFVSATRSSLNQTLRRFIGTKISWHQCTCRVIRVDTAIIFWSRSVIIFHDSIWWCASVSGMPSITVRPLAFLRLRTLVGCCTRCLSFGFCSWISLVVGASGRCTARSRGPRRD